jgi:hypothetical protein
MLLEAAAGALVLVSPKEKLSFERKGGALLERRGPRRATACIGVAKAERRRSQASPDFRSSPTSRSSGRSLRRGAACGFQWPAVLEEGVRTVGTTDGGGELNGRRGEAARRRSLAVR